ncbi:MAG: hypothetical protein IIW89_06410, partial [Alistipes sp.]|nr:hypothetical protein [Alistipes sp.]
EIVAKSLVDVGAGTSGPARAIAAVLEAAGMQKEDMAYILATGYGRKSVPASRSITRLRRCSLRDKTALCS